MLNRINATVLVLISFVIKRGYHGQFKHELEARAKFTSAQNTTLYSSSGHGFNTYPLDEKGSGQMTKYYSVSSPEEVIEAVNAFYGEIDEIAAETQAHYDHVFECDEALPGSHTVEMFITK